MSGPTPGGRPAKLAAAGGDASPGDDGGARYRAPALEKGLDILELLAREPGGLSLTAIANAMGRSLGEIYRIALALEARGFIRRDADGDGFALTLRLFELAHEHPPMNRLLAVALPEMERLASASEQSCHLVVVSGTDALVVAQTDSPRPMRYAVRLGARFPLLETSSGAVILAHSPADVVRRAAAAAPPGLADGLEARLAAIRDTGGERRDSLVVRGVVNVSRPVFDSRGVAAALTTPFLWQNGLNVTLDGATLATARAADTLSRALGGRDVGGRDVEPGAAARTEAAA